MKNDNQIEELGVRLREAREYMGFSQEEVAKFLNIPRPAVSLMESGARKVDATELVRLARLYQRSVTELTGEDAGEMSQEESVKLVARAASQLSEKDRLEILQFARFLQSKRQTER